MYQPWESEMDGRWHSAEISSAIGLEGALVTVYSHQGERQLHEGEVTEERMRPRAELNAPAGGTGRVTPPSGCYTEATTVGNARFYQAVYALVAEVPPGRVTTYGDIALALGWPRHARFVGYALATCPDDVDVPAHRVVNHRGEVSRAWGGGRPEEQIALLRAEGVTFTADGRVDLRRHVYDLPNAH